jgi:VWFA-related protein
MSCAEPLGTSRQLESSKVHRFTRFLAPAAAILMAAQTPEPPIIRLTTRLVEVNVIVRAKDGPVRNLTQSDFRIFDKGKEQKIALFSVSSRHKVRKPAAPLPAGVFTNLPEQRSDTPTSITVVLLDALNTDIQDQHYAKQQFIKFLSQIRPEDRVAIYALGTHLRVLNDFTNDSSRLVNSLARYRGESVHLTADSDPDPTATGYTSSDPFGTDIDTVLNEVNALIADLAIINRVKITVAAMEAIANHIGRLPGRKNLIWVTGSFPFSIGQHATAEANSDWNNLAGGDSASATGPKRGAASANVASRGSVQGADAGSAYDVYGAQVRYKPSRDMFLAFDQEVRRATEALSNAGVAVYPVDARGLVAAPKIMTAQAGATSSRANQGRPIVQMEPVGFHTMDLTAERTGGRAFYNTNDIQGAIRTALDDSEVTYSLGFYADSKSLDSKFHDLKVRVDRKDVDVRFRKGYFAYPEAEPNDDQRSESLQDAAWSPLDATGIDIAVRLERPKPGSVGLTISLDPASLAFQKGGDQRSDVLDVLFIQQAADGHDLEKIQQKVDLKFDEARFQALSKGIIIGKTLQLAADAARIRLVLLDRNSGNIGSLTIPLPR